MTDPSYPIFPVFAFLGFILALVPLPWHLEAWNSATCYYMIWASLACLNKFVNSVAWANNAINSAPIWCDISTRIVIGASVGIPAASLCINRRLYLIARMGAVIVTKAEKRRAILIDTLICVVFPVICMGLAFIVQGHRFNVYEEIGCYPAIVNTPATYFLVNWWPILLGLVSAAFCGLSLRAFALRRAQFKEFLSTNKTSLTPSRYFRLMALATTELLCTIPISSYGIYLNATVEPIQPWISWSNIHYDFSRVELIPSLIWRMDSRLVVALELGQWLNPICALLFFLFFGIAEEARRHYAHAFHLLLVHLNVKLPPNRKAKFATDLSSPSPTHPEKPPFVICDAPPAYALPASLTSWDSSDACSYAEASEKTRPYELLYDPTSPTQDMNQSLTLSSPSPSTSTHHTEVCSPPSGNGTS